MSMQTTGQGDLAVKKSRYSWKTVIVATAIVLACAIGIYLFLGSSGSAATTQDNYTYHTVGKENVTVKLSGTGTLQPADSYTVTTLISGEILSAPFEEGDVVEKNTVLYRLDSSDVSTSIEQAQLSLSQSQRSYSQKAKSLGDLKVKSTVAGTVTSLLVEEGDKVVAGQTIATIRDSGTMSLVIPFGTDDADRLFIGQRAEVTLDGSFERLNGTITKISAVEERLSGNMLVRSVTIEVENPGGINTGLAATAVAGDLVSSGSGTFEYRKEGTVVAGASGDVSILHVSEGDTVAKDQVLVTLSSDTLQNDVANGAGSVRDAELSLEKKIDQLDSYTIESPISGTIIEKFYKEGDTLESGKTLCTIFDLSYLSMNLYVDELDIAKVKVGQPVTVTAEALPNQTYQGMVTKININGKTTNGVTSYPVTIRIDEAEGLLPSMNVQAEIIVLSLEDVVAVPVAALQRGNVVLVQQEGAAQQDGVPAGYVQRQVTPGESDGVTIEIKEGLSEGEVVAVKGQEVPTASGMTFGGGGGGPMGGDRS